MKKIIIAFAAGQGLQVLLLYLSENLTYSDKALGFCTGVGLIVLVALIVGAWGAIFAPAIPSADKPVMKHRVATVPDRAKLKDLYPEWQIEDVDLDDLGIPDDLFVSNSFVKKEEEDV